MGAFNAKRCILLRNADMYELKTVTISTTSEALLTTSYGSKAQDNLKKRCIEALAANKQYLALRDFWVANSETLPEKRFFWSLQPFEIASFLC